MLFELIALERDVGLASVARVLNVGHNACGVVAGGDMVGGRRVWCECVRFPFKPVQGQKQAGRLPSHCGRLSVARDAIRSQRQGDSLSGFQLVKSGVSTFLTGLISIGVSRFSPLQSLSPPFIIMTVCSLLFCAGRLVPGPAILSRSNTVARDTDNS